MVVPDILKIGKSHFAMRIHHCSSSDIIDRGIYIGRSSYNGDLYFLLLNNRSSAQKQRALLDYYNYNALHSNLRLVCYQKIEANLVRLEATHNIEGLEESILINDIFCDNLDMLATISLFYS